jgi:Cu-Zn family superoxide dismutase
MTFIKIIGVATLGWFACTACDRRDQVRESTMEQARQPAAETEASTRAVATLEPKNGTQLEGEAFFVKQGDREVDFGVFVDNLSPGAYAVHIHENGDCSAPDASSAGGHWNPTNHGHGKWGANPFHLGDIGNIDVGADGDGTLSMSTDLWSLDEDSDHSVLGKSIVVHAGFDDFATQPDGAAGERIACGVIEWKTES